MCVFTSTADAIRSQGSVRWAAAGETVVLVCAEIRTRVLCGIEAFIDVWVCKQWTNRRRVSETGMQCRGAGKLVRFEKLYKL